MKQQNYKKIDKEFCITDNTVNVYKYRCLTEGLQLDEVKKNPIGYWMHNREKGVIVRWEDFRIEKDKVFAKPKINLNNPNGQTIIDQIENGFLNSASVGKIVVLEVSNDNNLKLKGQTKPTITKWFPREISIVDIPGNYNAVADLYDTDNKGLSLSDLQNFNINKDLEKIDLDKIITLLNIKTVSETEIIKKIEFLISQAKKSRSI